MDEADLDIDNQKAIYHYILETPGSHLRSISRDLKMNLSTLRYHINYLEREGLIVGADEMNTRTYYVSGKLSPEDKNLAALLRQKRFRDIILVAMAQPGITHSELSVKLSVKPSTLSKYLNLLILRNVISNTKTGREKHYYILDEKHVLQVLLAYRKSFWDALVDNVLEIYFER